MNLRFCLVAFGVLAASACSSGPPLVTNGRVTVADSAALPPPTPADLVQPAYPFVIGPFDKLEIDVYGVDALLRTVQADGSGVIRYPLAGEVSAAGLTPSELAAELEQRLGGFVRNPQVTVNLLESARQVVTVDGEVEEPGAFPIVGRMTLLQAIARAKGATELAQLRHVVLFRTVGGQRMAALYDVRAIRAGIYEDPLVYPQDVVTVGTSRARQIFQTAVEAAALLTTPLIILLQRR